MYRRQSDGLSWTGTQLRSARKDGRGSPRVDFEVAEKFLQRYTIREPVEQLLDRQSGAAKAGNPAHSGWIDPHRLFQGHRLAGLR